MRRSKDDRKWPHGRPTMVCPVCGGTGLDRARAILYTSSRATFPDDPDLLPPGHLSCSACEGRGRQTIEKILAGRST